MVSSRWVAQSGTVLARLAIGCSVCLLASALATSSLGVTASTAASTAVPVSQPEVVAGPTASPGPGGWQVFGPPASYYGFGFAGNGDLLVVGLDQKPATGPVKLFIARYDATGREVSHVALDRRYSALPTGAIVVDATNDSVLIREDISGRSSLRRVNSRTGKLVATIRLPTGISRVAVDKIGRIFGVGVDARSSTGLATVIVRLRADGTVSASYDAWLRSPPGNTLAGRSTLQLPVQIGYGRDGRLVILDEPSARDTGPPRNAPAVFTLTTAIRDKRTWSVTLEFRQGTVQAHVWAIATTGLAADAKGNVFLGEYIPRSDGLGPLGYRLRMFRKDGKVLASWGYKGNHQGLHWPYAPQVDASGRLWALDIDPPAHTTRIMVLADPPGG